MYPFSRCEGPICYRKVREKNDFARYELCPQYFECVGGWGSLDYEA